jgi:hypothetical protein
MKRLLSFVPRQPCRGPGSCWRRCWNCQPRRPGRRLAGSELITRDEDDMGNRLEQAVGLGEVVEPVLRGTQAWPTSGSVMGGVVGEAGGAPLDVAQMAFLLG